MELIFEKSVEERKGARVPGGVSVPADIPPHLRRKEPPSLPQVSELDAVRHFTALGRMNFSVDRNFYPLGSCTMKYNPKVLEKAAEEEGFLSAHPYASVIAPEKVQGSLRLIYELEEMLAEITGMDAVSLQPMAGAQGELAGMLMVRAAHEAAGRVKDHVIVPDTSHGTNPATARMAGYEVVTVGTGRDGLMDYDEFIRKLGPSTAAVLMTCPNTLGIFNPAVDKIAAAARGSEAFMYCDGANLNALMGKFRPGDAGFDIMHVNLHKTFGTPHGGGGPGAGPVCVKEELREFLPVPRVVKVKDRFEVVEDRDGSIGRLSCFFGNFGVLVKAYAYILLCGGEGLELISEMAVLNANYLKEKLRRFYEIPFGEGCLHEFVLSASGLKKHGVSAYDVAKFLIDKGIHPPTVYFPLIVSEAMMIEPTETESKQTLDAFAEAMKEAAELASRDPEELRRAPRGAPAGRLDETGAARSLKLASLE